MFAVPALMSVLAMTVSRFFVSVATSWLLLSNAKDMPVIASSVVVVLLPPGGMVAAAVERTFTVCCVPFESV